MKYITKTIYTPKKLPNYKNKQQYIPQQNNPTPQQNKNYILITNSITRTRQVAEFTVKNKIKRDERLAALRLLSIDLASSLETENKLFDRKKFLDACGFDDCIIKK